MSDENENEKEMENAPAPAPPPPPRKTRVPSKLKELFTVEKLRAERDGGGAEQEMENLHHDRLALLSMVHTQTWEEDVDLFVQCNMHPLTMARLVKRAAHENRKITSIAAVTTATVESIWDRDVDCATEALIGAVRLGVFGNPISDTASLMQMRAETLRVLSAQNVVEWDPPTLCAVVGRLCEGDDACQRAARRAARHVTSGAGMLLLGSTNADINAKLSLLRAETLISVACHTLLDAGVDPTLEIVQRHFLRSLALRSAHETHVPGAGAPAAQNETVEAGAEGGRERVGDADGAGPDARGHSAHPDAVEPRVPE